MKRLSRHLLSIRRLLPIAILVIVTLTSHDIYGQQSRLDSLERVLNQVESRDSTYVDLLNEISYTARRIDLYQSLEYATSASVLSGKMGYTKGSSTSLNNLANYYYLSADYPNALQFFHEAANLNRRIEYRAGLSFSYNGMGMVYMRQGNYPLAIDYIQRSLNIAEDIGDLVKVAFSNYTMGNAHMSLGDFEMAESLYKKSLDISKEIEKKDFISVAYRDLGQLYSSQGRLDEAMDHFQNAMVIMEEMDDLKGISHCLIYIGMIHKRKMEIDSAMYYFLKSTDLSRENGFQHNLCTSHFCLGASYHMNGEYSKALDYTLSSLQLATELDILPEQRDAYGLLSKIYGSTNDYQKAYKSHVVFKKLNDSIFNDDAVRTVTNLTNWNNYQKEKQEAQLLQEQRNAVQETEAEWQRTVRNFFIGAFLIMGALVVIVLYVSIQRRKANEQLHVRNDEIQSKNKELEVQQATLEEAMSELQKAQSQLVQSEKMASVGVLTAGIAHEINNPLNFIHGGKTALDRYAKRNLKDHEEKLKPLLETIEMGIKRVNGIVLSLNRFSRKGSGKNEACDIHLIVDNCLLMLKNEIKGRITVTKKYTKESYVLMGQEGELHQVILNILANAVQAIDGEGAIKVRTSLESRELLLEIEDTGSGISKKNLDKVTSPFFTTKDPGKGTGLGLSIAYKIIQDHKGNICYESEEGKGTKVMVRLPISEKREVKKSTSRKKVKQ